MTEETNIKLLKKRFYVIGFFMIVWSLVIIYHLLYYTVIEQKQYLVAGNKLAMRKWSLPATRGRILDQNGTPLAWTKRIFELNLVLIPIKNKRKLILEDKLKKYLQLNDYVLKLGNIKTNIHPAEFDFIKTEFINNYHELELKFKFERCYVDYLKLRDILGGVKSEKNNQYGISGLELKYDERLKGVDGISTVMLNKTGDLIPGTLKCELPTKNGNDVTLDSTLDEILK